MNSQLNSEATLTKIIRKGRAVIVAGTGVSIAASFDATTKQPHPQASWTGLLEDGLKWLKDHGHMEGDIADAQLKLLEKSPQTHRFISVAQDVTAEMGGAESKHFADWLRRTVGTIKAHDRKLLDALDDLRQHGHLLATTNYDELLLSNKLELVTWLETDALIGVVRNWDTSKIIFLHGYWRRPESVILDWKSYDKIAHDEQYRQDLAAFWKTHTWVYVGCGVNGLTDPDFGLLLKRYGERARQVGHWDYCLVLDDQKNEFQAYFDRNNYNIRAIPFGKEHSDLPQYLRSLLPAPAPPAPVVLPDAASPPAEPKMSPEVSKIRNLYLKEARRDIEDRLAASIHNARFIDLSIQDEPAAIKLPWGYRNPETRQSYETVEEAFNACDRRLLLLGAPGSGKTTALLHIAKLLIQEAEQINEAPIPFVVNLSKFRFERSEGTGLWSGFGRWNDTSSRNGSENPDTKFEDWLLSEMANFPRLSRELAHDWIRHERAAILLDGLDEFNDERRADLVRLLNKTFLRYYPDLVVVICSRTNEYLVLRSSEETTLQLPGCVQLQPLSDAQIAVYLEAAKAESLLSALPADSALQELARTPLTLSMLVLAYGGLAPTDLPKTGSLSESRHHLFESYVDRMLQRWERRKRNIPFDNSKINDVPISDYGYNPNKVHRWLGWLALALSVRMRTSFSISNFHSILSIGVQPTRQPFNFIAVYFAIGALLLISLCLIALSIVPLNSADLLSSTFIIVSPLLLLPLAASGKGKWKGGLIFLIIAFPIVFLLDNAILAHLLCAIFPGRISPLPVSVFLLVAVLFILLATEDGFDDKGLQKLGLLFVGGIGVLIGIQFLAGDWQLPFLDRAWWYVVIAAIYFGLCGAVFLGTHKPFRIRIAIFGIIIGFAAFASSVTWWMPEPNWMMGVVAIVASLVLILAVVEVPTAVLILLGYFLFALTGGIAANHQGAILGVALFGLLCATCIGLGKTGYVSENELVERFNQTRYAGENDLLLPLRTSQYIYISENELIVRLVASSKIVADETLELLDRLILSPCLWRIAAIGRRFPWRYVRFISFCKEAFLLKQSSQEYEFIHRLLRDYFALRELRPRLSAPDKNRRLDAIRFLGFQGEAALDVLTEFAEDSDPSVRAAAVTGLSHISSPIVTRCYELHINDGNPLVRQAIIPGIFKLPGEDREQLLSQLQPLGDGCELDPLLDCRQMQDSWRYRAEIDEMIKRLGKIGIEQLKERLKSKDRRVRMVAIEVLAQFVGTKEQQQLLSKQLDGRSPWLDPAKPISRSRVLQCVRHLRLTEEEVLAHYRALVNEFGLKVNL